MTYFKTRDIVAIVMCAAFWGALNLTLAPIIFQTTHLPFTCDLLGFVTLTLVTWWTRKLGTASLTGLLVAGLTFTLRPNALYMLGFIAASILFDILTRLVGYQNSIEKPLPSIISIISFSTICAGIAGLIIGRFFLEFPATLELWAGLHAIGGFIGGVIGITIIRALTARQVIPSHIQ
ncbi:MAG: hypothetical protein PVG48_02545 [Candidatus Bathyarchaeota archaeon]|jgi:hypothetical protein